MGLRQLVTTQTSVPRALHQLRAVLLCTSCLWWFIPTDALAHDTPADVLVPTDADLPLPALPEGFIEERIGRVTWAYPPSSADLVAKLQREFAGSFFAITDELGVQIDSRMVIRIARGPDDMRALAPQGAPPPDYAVGVAYPSLGLVILSLVNPQGWFPPDLPSVLTHELSHIALHRAVGGKALPRWFVEGLAVHQAGEQNLVRVQTLWEAAVVDEVLPLAALSKNFPRKPHEVNRAYAQSADLVAYMLRTERDRERLPVLLRHVAEGMSFEEAVLSSYHVDLAYLDREWRQALNERFRVLPLVLTGTALWGGIAVLAVVAFVRRRRDHRAKMERWAEEEAAQERAQQALERERQRSLIEELEREAQLVGSLTGESGVPTVEHDGHRYTLH